MKQDTVLTDLLQVRNKESQSVSDEERTMKTFMTTLCCVALMAQVSFAQTQTETYNKQEDKLKTNSTETREHVQNNQNTYQSGNAQAKYMGSNKLIGAYIYGPNEETVGDINSIMLDKDGKIGYAIVGIGGVAGVGETEIAVPWQVFNCKCEVKDGEKCCRATLPMTAEQLEKAPALEASEYADLENQSWLERNAKFYGVDASAAAASRGSMLCLTELDGLQLTGNKAMETAASDGTQKTYTSSDRDEDADLGTIEEVVIDVQDHKASYVVVGDDSGVVSERHVAIPFSKIQFSKKDGEYCAKIAATASDLKTATEVTPGEYKELDSESVRRQIDNGLTSR